MFCAEPADLRMHQAVAINRCFSLPRALHDGTGGHQLRLCISKVGEGR